MNRRGFFVTAGATLLAGAAALGNAPVAQAGVDPSKRPLDVRVASVSGNTVTLAWTSPAPDSHGLWVYIYDNDAKEFITTARSSGATLERLRSGTTHTFTAIWGDFTDDPKNPGPNFSVSAESAPVSVTLPPSSDTTPPTTPNARTEVRGDGTVFVTVWDPSTDDVTPQDEIQYDALSWTGFTSIYGVTSGESEWHGIRAVDEAGNRSGVG